MSRPMPLIVSAVCPSDHATQDSDALSFVSVKVVVTFQSGSPFGPRTPQIPNHLFFLRDDEGGGP